MVGNPDVRFSHNVALVLSVSRPRNDFAMKARKKCASSELGHLLKVAVRLMGDDITSFDVTSP